jgi:hypothetical protein
MGNTAYRGDLEGQASFDRERPQALAHWRFDTNEWQRFIEFDKNKRQKQDAREVFVIFIILCLVVAAFLIIGSPQALAAILIIAGIIAAAVVAHLQIQGRRQRRIESHDTGGEIYITLNGIWTNGEWFDWGEHKTAWRLVTVTPVLADSGVRLPPGAPGYLEFRCRARTARHFIKVDKKWRVPVPIGKEDEAREVFRRLGKPSANRDKFGLPAD